MSAEEKPSFPQRMKESLRDRKELHKQRGKLYRLGAIILGCVLVLVGLALSLPGVPGPGLLVAAVGLFVLALEFDRAERLLERLLDQLDDASERASRAKPWQKALLVALGVAAGAAVAASFVLWDVPLLPG